MTFCPSCGFNLNASPDGRSLRQHRYFHAGVVGVAWRAIEDDLNREFPSRERLRYYLTVKAGFYDETTLPAETITEGLIEYLKRHSAKLFFAPHGDAVQVLEAKSIAFGKMGGKEFKELVDKVITVITNEILPGVTKPDLLREINIMAGFDLKGINNGI